MNLFLRIVSFIGLLVLVVSCGSKDAGADKVEVAKIENGVPKDAEGRVILSSMSENSLICPEGKCEGQTINRQKLEKAIADEFDHISKVFDIALFTKGDFGEYLLKIGTLGLASLSDRVDIFGILFSVEAAVQGKQVTFRDIECACNTREFSLWDGTPSYWALVCVACRSATATLGKEINIPLYKIVEANTPRQSVPLPSHMSVLK